MNRITSQYLVDIIARYMCLDRNAIWIRDQNRRIPNDDGLYVVVGLVSAQPLASVSFLQQGQPSNWDQLNNPPIAGEAEQWDQPGQNWDTAPTISEVSQVNVMETIQVDLLCRSNDILARQWEVIAALQSVYAQQVMERNSFKIFRIPRSFVNTSAAEGGSQLNRYSLTFPVLVWYRKTTLLAGKPFGDYYDDFRTRVDDEKTIGTDKPLIEFEITPEGITS